MARSDHNGCGGRCYLCHYWKVPGTPKVKQMKKSDRRRFGDARREEGDK